MKIFIPCLFFSCLVRFTPFCALGRSNRNQTVYVGEAIKLKCDALSNKTVQWSKDGAVLQSKTTGCGTSLLIGFVKYSEEGMYTCEVINKAGAIDASYNEAVRVNGQYVHTEQFSPYLHSSEEKFQIGIRKFSKMDDSMLVDNGACFFFEQ